ncbi:amino acid adenylation protein [Streptomyces fodineus]|uniref:Amino acid adenylation protein n=1 Tax=Streptomyces fodineus TaxID=1904616 RepID=A0A1D7Y7B8_9ACTN|nr:AMP-binding protein [Streptomyces fodineus]AOR31527.1 amino acid adenylation protein [Streptomyces fodineus]
MTTESTELNAPRALPSLWGGTADPPCLLEALARTAATRPGDIAISDDGHELTYRDLTRWIGSIAVVLADHGICPGDRVAITGSRSAAIVAAMLATVSTGATYVPLDADYPVKRLEHMKTDSGAKVLLFADHEPAFATGVRSLRIPPAPGRPAADTPGDAAMPRQPCQADLPVYVIYTSGSTGLPKGVVLPHSSIDNMAQWQRSHSVRPDLRTAQFTPLNFDVWFQEVLGTLCGGGTLVIMPEPLRRDPIALLDWLADNRIERLFLPYVALNMLTAAAAAAESLDGLVLQEVNLGGEQLVCTPAVRDFFRRLPGCRLNIHYGQSESAMVTAHTLTGPPEDWPTLPPIGRPLPGCEVIVEPVDQGEPAVGELLVTGLPLSTGYLNQPGLNASRYIPLDRTRHGHNRAFRTGDLVRVEDDVIHYVGRADNEVKIRGVRVNPLEVDACLLAQPGVTEAVCVPIEIAEGSRQLRAAVTVNGEGDTFDVGRAMATLTELLPGPSVPVSITVLPELPRTPSSKADRKAVAQTLAGMHLQGRGQPGR